ncbi:MAG: hypothetical protein WCO30_02640 [bacterium]
MKTLETILKDLLAEGVDKLHVLADFEGTLTKEFVDGKKVLSIVYVLRDCPGYLSTEYQEEANNLFDEYHPYENNLSLSIENRSAKMHEWWTKHFNLLIKSGLKKEHIEKVATSGIVQFRDGAKAFLKLTHDFGIPVIICSASGLGEAVSIFCKYEGVDFDNIHYLTNSFKWNDRGEAVGVTEPIIHSLNKNETLIHEVLGLSEIIKGRNNVLLLGNSPGDLEMSKGSEAKKVVTVAFVDSEAGESEWRKGFDIVEKDYVEINKVLSV